MNIIKYCARISNNTERCVYGTSVVLLVATITLLIIFSCKAMWGESLQGKFLGKHLVSLLGGITACSAIFAGSIYGGKKHNAQKKNLIKRDEKPIQSNTQPTPIKNRFEHLTLREQALHEALSFTCQNTPLPNVRLMLEAITRFMANASREELLSMSNQVTDERCHRWVTEVTTYLNDRWAWPAASGKYSVIRQLITDPNLNAFLQEPQCILAIFARSQLGNPVQILELNVAEMLIAGFRDQHPTVLECQPYNNAFFVEDIRIRYDVDHENRLLKGYLIRKESSFIQVMRSIETAAKNIGIRDVPERPNSSRFDDRYSAELWEKGNIMTCFQQLKRSIDSEKKFLTLGHNFANSYGQSLQGFLALCRILYPKSIIIDDNPDFSFISSHELAEAIASHPTVLLEYDICHLWYDSMHLKAMFAGQSSTYHFKDDQCSMIDIIEKVLSHIQKVRLKPENAITAQQLYLRLYALADLEHLPYLR